MKFGSNIFLPPLFLLVVLAGAYSYDLTEGFTFLDVGQGDAILLQNGSQQILIDGGQGMVVLDRLAEHMPWFDRRIDIVVLTHPQRDHMEGLLHVLQRYDVDVVIMPDVPEESAMHGEFLRMIKEGDVRVTYAWVGQKILFGDAEIEIIAPLNTAEYVSLFNRDVNNASVGMRVDWHGMSWLLTGDAEKEAEKLMVDYYTPSDLLDVDILKAGHHGSKTSTTQALLDATTPSVVVLSVGEGNRFGHPHESVLQRISTLKTFRTDLDDDVVFRYFADSWFLF